MKNNDSEFGIAHATVVPTNFDETENEEDNSE